MQNRNKKLRFLRLLHDLWDFAVLVLPSAAPADAYDRVSAIRVGLGDRRRLRPRAAGKPWVPR